MRGSSLCRLSSAGSQKATTLGAKLASKNLKDHKNKCESVLQRQLHFAVSRTVSAPAPAKQKFSPNKRKHCSFTRIVAFSVALVTLVQERSFAATILPPSLVKGQPHRIFQHDKLDIFRRSHSTSLSRLTRSGRRWSGSPWTTTGWRGECYPIAGDGGALLPCQPNCFACSSQKPSCEEHVRKTKQVTICLVDF